MKTTYEWVVEQMELDWTPDDEDGDIFDTSGFDTLADALAFADTCDRPCVISLRRERGDDCHGSVERGMAYSGDAQFDDGADIPQRFRALLDAQQPCAHFNPYGSVA